MEENDVNALNREETIDFINKLIEECEHFWDWEGLTGDDELMKFISIYKEKGIL